jgi:hypothetical protein
VLEVPLFQQLDQAILANKPILVISLRTAAPPAMVTYLHPREEKAAVSEEEQSEEEKVELMHIMILPVVAAVAHRVRELSLAAAQIGEVEAAEAALTLVKQAPMAESVIMVETAVLAAPPLR